MAVAHQTVDWQMHKTLPDCNRYMLKNQINTDVRFRIEPPDGEATEISAHKYVLISRSPVFNTMLYGSLAANTPTDEPITITDVEVDAFIALLGFMYTDDVALTQDNVLPILYASKKYLIPNLTMTCTKYLESTLNADNVCQIYEHSMLYDETHLLKRSKIFIETRTEEIVHSTTFLEIPLQALMNMLKFDRLTISELDLFKMTLSWATEDCKRQGLDPSGKNQRQVLGDAIYLLRFPTLELKDFANYVALSGILSAEEKCAVFEYLLCDDKKRVTENLPFPTNIREQPIPSLLQRFTNFSKASVISGDYSAMKVQCDRPVLLKGLGVSGSVNYDPLAEVQITVKQDRHVLYNRSVPIKDDRSGDVITCILPETLMLQSLTCYVIKVTFHFFGEHDQGSCKRGKNGLKTIRVDGVNFEFDSGDSAGFVHQILFCSV